MFKKILISFSIFFVIVSLWIILVNITRLRGVPLPRKQVFYGFSFNPYVFEQLGLNWHSAYLKLIDSFDWEWVRLSFYWNKMVDENNVLKLDDLWFQINEAEKRNINVVLVVGVKAPFYPEVYAPAELTKHFTLGENIKADSPTGKTILKVESELVPIIATSSAITYWQVENEPFAGPVNNWQIDISLLEEEMKLVRRLDPMNRPIILTHPAPYPFDSNWKKLLNLLKSGDVLGVNYFPKTRTPDIINFNLFGKHLKVKWPEFVNIPTYIWGPFSPDFKKVAKIVSNNGNKLWVMEMQAEPYLTKFNEVKGKIFVFQPEDIVKSDNQIRKSGINHIGLWGAHWWLLTAERGDSSWIEAVQQIVGKKSISN